MYLSAGEPCTGVFIPGANFPGGPVVCCNMNNPQCSRALVQLLFSSCLQCSVLQRLGQLSEFELPAVQCVTTETRPLDRLGQLGEFELPAVQCVSHGAAP